MSVVRAVAAALAGVALPNSGRNCRVDCVGYPVTGQVVAAQFPRDYLWMLPAMLALLLLSVLVAVLHEYAGDAGPAARVSALLGFGLAALGSGLLLVDCFVQVTVVQPSFEKGQLDGLALITQYNPNVVLIAVEEIGYLLIDASPSCAGPRSSPTPPAPAAPSAGFSASGVGATLVALIRVAAIYGTDRQDTFEVAAISIVWVVLITERQAQTDDCHHISNRTT